MFHDGLPSGSAFDREHAANGGGDTARLLLQGGGGHIQLDSDPRPAVYNNFPEQVLCRSH